MGPSKPRGVTVLAQDDAVIDAQTLLVATVSPVNDAGAGLLNTLAGLLLDDYQYTSKSGTRNLVFGDKVLLADDYFADSAAYRNVETNGDDQLVDVVDGVKRAVVTLSDDFGGKGIAGSSYLFIGADPSDDVNIGIENYLDTTRWLEVGGTYQFMGTPASVNLGEADYTDYGYWKRLNPTNLITDSTVYAGLEAIGTVLKKEGLTGSADSFYGLIDRNDVRSKVEARLQNVTVASAGDVSVQAIEGARIRAVEDSTVSPWEGTGGVIATNNVLSSAKAHVDGGSITTTAGGHLFVDGFNQSLIEAQTRSTIEAWEAKTAVVAFNAIGWQAQNVLFNAIDALLGDPTIASIFGGEQPAEVQAYIVDCGRAG